MNVYDVSKKLIGNINPVGASHIDDKRLINLEAHIELVYSLLDDINDVSKCKDRVEYSIKIMGEKADRFLKSLPSKFENINEVKK